MRRCIFLFVFLFCFSSWSSCGVDELYSVFLSKESEFSGFPLHQNESIMMLDQDNIDENCQKTGGDEHILSGYDGGLKNQYYLDRRSDVDATKGPYSAVFSMRMYSSVNYEDNSYSIGTAFSIGPRVALTAAHNVCLRTLDDDETRRIPFVNSIIDRVLCYYGMDGASCRSSFDVNALAFRKEYVGEKSFRAYDYALLFFDQLISEKAGMSENSNVIAPKLFGESVGDFLVTGYPKTVGKAKSVGGKKEAFHEKGLQQYGHKGKVLRSCDLESFGFQSRNSFDEFLSEKDLLESKNLFHKVDATGGQSGSPIIDTTDTSAIGIHTGGFKELRHNFNRGIKFTEDFFSDLENFYREISNIFVNSRHPSYPVKIDNNYLKCWDAENFYVVFFKKQGD